MDQKKQSNQDKIDKLTIKTKKSFIRRCFKFFTYFVGIILSLLLMIFVFLNTEYGQHKTLEITQYLLSDKLIIGKINGNLKQGLSIENLQYKDDKQGFLFNASNINVIFNINKLLFLKVEVPKLEAENIDIKIKSNPDGEQHPHPSRENSGFLANLLQIYANGVKINTLQLRLDDYSIGVHDFTSSISFKHNMLKIGDSQINLIKIAELTGINAQQKGVDNKKNSDTADDSKELQKIAQPFSQYFEKPFLHELQQIFAFNVHIDAIKNNHLQYKPYDSNSIDAENILIKDFVINSQGISLSDLNMTSDIADLSGKGKFSIISGIPSDLKIMYTGKKKANEKGLFKLLTNHSVTLTVLGEPTEETTLDVNIVNLIAQNQNIQLIANVLLSEKNLPFNLQVKSKQYNYSYLDELQKEESIGIKDLDLKLGGTVKNYAIDLYATVNGNAIPANTNAWSGRGSLSSIAIDKINTKIFDGLVTGKVIVNWNNKLQWGHDLLVQGIETNQYFKHWNAKLSGQLRGTGLINEDTINLSYPIVKLTGMVNNKEFNADSVFTVVHNTSNSTNTMKLEKLSMKYGINTLSSQGLISQEQNSRIRMDINAPDIEGLLPGTKGYIVGSIESTAMLEKDNPVFAINSNLKINNFQLYNLQVNKVESVANIENLLKLSGSLDLTVNGVNYDNKNYGNLNLSLYKTPNNEQVIKLLSKADNILESEFILQGSLDEKQKSWHGYLNSGKISSQQINVNAQLDKPTKIDIDLNKQALQLQAHCWIVNNQASICADKNLNFGQNNEASVTVKNLNANLFNAFLKPHGIELGAQITTNIDFQKSANKAMQIKFNFAGKNIDIQQSLADRKANVKIQDVSVNGELNEKDLLVDSKIDFGNNQTIINQIKIQDPINAKQLSGNIKINNLQADIWKAYIIPGDILKGVTNANLELYGTLLSPLLKGSLQVGNIEYKSKNLPIDITNSNVALNFNGNSSVLAGEIKNVNNESLFLKGQTSWANLEDIRAHVDINSDLFMVKYLNMVTMPLRPNLSIDVSKDSLSLKGQVDIVKGSIYLKSLPESAVAISEDEVLINKKSQFKENLKKQIEQGRFAINSDIAINIIDQMQIDAYGFKTSLKGNLKVIQDQSKLGLHGDLNIAKGEYKIYGRDLVINSGKISFAGSPDNPILNIEAVRPREDVSDNVVAGVKITGLAKKPRFEIFTKPAKSQQEALSYFLTGSGPEAGGANQLGTLALLAGISTGSALIDDIGEKFGIKNLSLSSENSGDKTQLSVSGNVSPRIRLKYSVGLFDGLSKFAVRYKMFTDFYVQATKGLSNSVDFIYQFEF